MFAFEVEIKRNMLQRLLSPVGQEMVPEALPPASWLFPGLIYCLCELWLPVTKQRELLHDIGLNFYCVDLQHGEKALDLVGDFSTSRNFGVSGRVWVELKTAGKKRFQKDAKAMQTTVKTEFASLRRRDRSFGGVLLLVAECEGLAEVWAPPSLKVYLLRSETGKWQQLVGSTHKAARGQVVGKAAFAQLWLAKPLFTQRRYTSFSEVLRSSEASSQKFSEYIQDGCFKEGQTIQTTPLGGEAAPNW